MSLVKVKRNLLKVYVKFNEKTHKHEGTELKYMFSKNNSDTLIVSFSGFSPGGARYNYVKTLKKTNINKLFILDNFGFDRFGSYYIGRNSHFNEEKATIDLINKIKKENKVKKVIFIGTSKGGYASLYFGFKYSADAIIIGAPQYYLGRYASESGNPDLVKYIIGKSGQGDFDYMDSLLPNILQKNSSKDTKVFLQYSNQEYTYEAHIKDLVNDLEKNKINSTFEVLDYKNHSDVGFYFPEFLLKILKDI
ncbi:hypothetical protein [Peribacillus asahii]|uniref:hypothetical protein n=1 Tax=Peribacillus asahii TaxID=228899 RepID=UPI0038096EE2